MGHRAKHLRRNWAPGRVKAAKERAKAQEAVEAADAERKALSAEFESGDTELELGS